MKKIQVLSLKQLATIRGGIVGGEEATPGQFPWQGSLITRNEENNVNEYPWQG